MDKKKDVTCKQRGQSLDITSSEEEEDCCYVCGLSDNEEVLLICDLVFFYFLVKNFNSVIKIFVILGAILD